MVEVIVEAGMIVMNAVIAGVVIVVIMTVVTVTNVVAAVAVQLPTEDRLVTRSPVVVTAAAVVAVQDVLPLTDTKRVYKFISTLVYTSIRHKQ